MSFINPLFLIAIGTALLPVLYHLVRKIRAKKVPFSSLMFLKATSKELVKRRRLRDLLLMAVRAAIFGLLALAFARPFFTEAPLPFVSGQEDQSVVLLLDRSYSMQYGDRFAQAKAEALRRLEAAGSDDEFAVVTFADEAQQATQLSRDRTLHRNVVENALQVSYRPTDFYKPLRMAEEILQGAQHDDRVVVLISDFQRAGWTGSLDNWKLGEGITFVPVKVAPGDVSNAYVEAFNLARQRSGDQVALRFDARVGEEGDAADEEQVVRLSVADEPADEQALAPGSSRRVSFQRVASREGFYQGELALTGADALSVDDHYYFTYPVEPRPALLVVDEAGGAASDAFFLRNAFDLGEAALYRFEAGGRQRLGSLQNYRAVFMTNASALTEGETERLRAYVERGGSLILSFGNRTALPSVSGLLEALGIGSVEEKVTVRSRQSGDAIIGEIDLRHPIFNVFAASETSTILRPRFRQYVRVAPDTGAVVIGRYDTGDPFLIEHPLGQGKVLVYTATFSTDWTDFPVNELYVPFLYQLVKYAVGEGGARHLFTVGEVVPLQGAPGEVWEVRTPEGDLHQITLDAYGAGFFRETEVPGHYAAARGRDRFFFSVNVDARESVLQARDQEEVYAAVVGTASAEAAEMPNQAAVSASEEEERRQKLWRYLILLVLALFAFETYYANRKVVLRRA